MSLLGGEATKKVRVMAWDPKCPAVLLLPTTTKDQAQQQQGQEAEARTAAMQIDSMLSHAGVGCNEHEIAALIQLLDAHESQAELKPSVRRSWSTIKTVSKAYRFALRECLSRWEDNLAEIEENAMTDDTMNINIDSNNESNDSPVISPDLEVENLELLKLVYAVTHLSEIFLFPPPPESRLEYYEDSFQIPGAATADTVRYLRHHHTVNALQQMDPDVLQELTDSLHPDQVDEGTPYWTLMNALVRRGNLEQAWALLSRHSLFRRAVEASNDNSLPEYDARQLEEYKEGFLDMRRLLLSAPLPGGRDDEDDVGLDGPSAEDIKRPTELLLQDVEMSAYQMWETSRTTTEGSDFPLSYNPRAASIKRQTWMAYIHELEAIHKLKLRIPELKSVLAVLSGDLKGVQFESWAEALIAELIYSNPLVRPTDIYIRAERLMKKNPPTNGEMDNVLLSIMKGDAGRVIEAMHAFGGGSGAALPAIMTSLLCNMYIESDLCPSKELQVDLLQVAAYAIVSSLANKSRDVGARLAIRLLLPYVKPRADTRIVATLVDTLEHHTPSSDVEARNLLSLCRHLVEQKSVRVLDGCVSLILSRYRQYLAEQRPGGALHWLLVGIEFESLVCVDDNGDIPNWQKIEAVSICHRHLITWCTSIAGQLLRGMLEEKNGIGLVYATAEAMVKSVQDGPLESYASQLPDVRVLGLVLEMFDAMAENTNWTTVARNITFCLQEEANENDDGIVSSLAPRSMHWDLLQIGHRVLQADEKRQGMERKSEYRPSFDVKGVQVLMEQLTIITTSRELEGLKPLPCEQVETMKSTLGNGLMRAFVAENARRKPSRSRDVDESIAGIKAINLHKENGRTQKRVVQMMLDI